MQSWQWKNGKHNIWKAVVTYCALLVGLAGFGRLNGTALAQEAASDADAKFVVVIDFATLRSTNLGKKLIEIGKAQASKHIKDEAGKNSDLTKVYEAIGFDPFEEIQSIVISSSSFENPERSLLATIQLKKTTGNLEGLILGVPGYSESKYQGHTIHSAKPDEKTELHASFVTDEAANKRIVFSTNRGMLEQSLGKRASVANPSTKTEGNPQLVSVRVIGLPADLVKSVAEGPHAAITKMLRNLKLDLFDANDNLKLVLEVSTEKEEQSEQVRQMLQGLIALLQFAQTTDIKDKDLQQLKKYTTGLKADRQGTVVKLEAQFPSKDIVDAIDKEVSKHR